jgi:hypothetical protein
MRLTRSSMLAMRTTASHGVVERAEGAGVVWRHAQVRDDPVATIIGLQVGALIGGPS